MNGRSGREEGCLRPSTVTARGLSADSGGCAVGLCVPSRQLRCPAAFSSASESRRPGMEQGDRRDYCPDSESSGTACVHFFKEQVVK